MTKTNFRPRLGVEKKIGMYKYSVTLPTNKELWDDDPPCKICGYRRVLHGIEDLRTNHRFLKRDFRDFGE